MAVTIKDIAKHANVSPMTVSLSLRNRPGVSVKKREEIRRLAKKLGYRPNIFGQGLQGGRTHSLGILWSLDGPHDSSSVTRELTLRARQRDYFSYVLDSRHETIMFDQILEDFAQRRVDGVIIQHNYPKEVESRLQKFPAAVVISDRHERISVDFIHQDRLTGIRQSAQYFLSQGRRRPLALSYAEVNRYKAEAFLAEFEHQGVTPSRDAILELPSMEDETILNCLETWFSGGRWSADAVFCHLDGSAAILMKWLRSQGLRIPQDVAVVGFNDLDFCRWMDPPLASIHRNDEILADEIDQLIFSRLSHPNLPPRSVTVPMKFVHRESAG